MNFGRPSEADPRRIEIRRWFEQHPHAHAASPESSARGWIAANWPESWGIGADAETMIMLGSGPIDVSVAI